MKVKGPVKYAITFVKRRHCWDCWKDMLKCECKGGE